MPKETTGQTTLENNSSLTIAGIKATPVGA
jgi:hypothetical protein